MSVLAREELQRYSLGRPTAVTIGNFDGVHLGHQHLVRFVIERAKVLGLASGVVTLYPDPVRVLRPDEPMPYLTSLEERLELLKALGLEVVAPLTFTSELAELSPREFVTMLRDDFGMRLLIMGPDNAFGRNREATPEKVALLGEELGFTVEVLPKPLVEADHAVSASAIRAALAAGDLETVYQQLGRHYSLRGPVVHGAERGRQMGFPTANVGVTADRALPALGIYATIAHLGENAYPSATSVGTNPTFGQAPRTVETYIMDFDRDIYERTMRVEFVSRLRDEKAFEGMEALKAQIAQDVEDARRILASRSLRG
ncbi:MAG TPA: bifunctional riboflavin kinase/FAD synthetase [Dehalococcoidia bacterium]|nr:bifunctional riboflavin kinase/FAD synthetase [Dehalococcoidia bacterium]